MRSFYRHLVRSIATLTVAFVVGFLPGAAHAAGAVGILYPDLGAPYNDAFESIANGVAAETDTPIRRFPLRDGYSVELLQQQFSAEAVQGLVALGRRGINAVHDVKWSGPTVLGAVVRDASKASKFGGIALDPEPRAVIARLASLAPRVRNVFTVVNPDQSGWLMEHSHTAAASLGISLQVKEAETPRLAAVAYGEILETLDPSRDAIWLQLDPIDEATLRLILSSAWTKRFVVFSNHPDHAQRGALYSVIPDYTKVGRRLGALLIRTPRSGTSAGLQPNSDLRLAVNLRTARHLGFAYTPRILGSIEAVYQ